MGDFAGKIEVLAAVLVAAAMLVATAGQQEVPECAQKLVPCANYLGSAKPPASCCGPIKEAVKDELPCLCSLFNSTQLLKAFNINLTQALELPKNCGIPSNQSICNSTSTSTSPVKGSSASPSSTTPASPSSNTVKPAGSVARSSTWIGISGLSGLLLLWCAVVA